MTTADQATREVDSRPVAEQPAIDIIAGGRRPSTAVKVEATGVHVRFANGLHALGPLDLSLYDGEFVCLVGPSGCGKSTFLRIVAGLHNPSEGTVAITPRDPSRTPVAMVFQDYSIYPWKTVLANARVGLDIQRVRKREGNRRATEWLRKLGLGDFLGAYPGTLSGGMRQRVSIARALTVEPETLLMDEPFAALDAQLRTILQDQLLELWQSDRRTVLFVTHSLEEAILLGDRVIVMSARPGRAIAEFEVPFDRPRTGELRGDARFAALQQEIWDVLRDEVDRSLALQGMVVEDADD